MISLTREHEHAFPQWAAAREGASGRLCVAKAKKEQESMHELGYARMRREECDQATRTVHTLDRAKQASHIKPFYDVYCKHSRKKEVNCTHCRIQQRTVLNMR